MIYAREPLRIVEGVPVFYAGGSRYDRNYDRIAADHLAGLEADGVNPFIPEPVGLTMEGATAAIMRKHVQAGDELLDAGCGNGRLLALFPDCRRYAADISIAYLKIVRAAGIDGVLARIEDLPYAEDSFDHVVCSDALEHVLDLHSCVAELLRVLRPKGTLTVRVPDSEDLAIHLTDEQPYAYVHLRRFDTPTLQLLFGRIFTTSILTMVEVSAYALGSLGREIICTVRKP